MKLEDDKNKVQKLELLLENKEIEISQLQSPAQSSKSSELLGSSILTLNAHITIYFRQLNALDHITKEQQDLPADEISLILYHPFCKQ